MFNEYKTKGGEKESNNYTVNISKEETLYFILTNNIEVNGEGLSLKHRNFLLKTLNQK